VFFAPFLGLTELPFFMDCKNSEKTSCFPLSPEAKQISVNTTLGLTQKFHSNYLPHLYENSIDFTVISAVKSDITLERPYFQKIFIYFWTYGL